MGKAAKKESNPTNVVLLEERSDVEPIEGVSEETVEEWQRAQASLGSSWKVLMSDISTKTRPNGASSKSSADSGCSADLPPWEETPVQKPKETGAFLQSEKAEALGIRELHRLVQSLDDCFFVPEPDYRRVGVLCQRVLCAAAHVVARVYPKELSGVDVSQPRVAVHVLDSFFASRLGENLDEPSRKLMRHLVVLTDDLLHLGTAGRSQAAVCMESVRFLVSSLLVLL
jgi:hypothetical protein